MLKNDVINNIFINVLNMIPAIYLFFIQLLLVFIHILNVCACASKTNKDENLQLNIPFFCI